MTVSIQDIIDGKYGSGKEVCIKDFVNHVLPETDGDYHVRFGNYQYAGQTFIGFVTELTPQYVTGNRVAIPPAGQTQRVHGMVRWDQGHGWWEMHPIDWIGP